MSRSDDGVIKASTGKAQTRGDIVELEIGQLVEHLLRRQACRQQVAYIGDANPQPAHARTPATLCRIDGNSVSECGHGQRLGPTGYTAARRGRRVADDGC